jgi:hypothetical protein
MITPGYGLTSTERVLPRLALDFTTASLDARVTVTRALNTATRVNSLGYIETINANLPRFDYDPANITACRGLLIEEARTNLYASSETLDNGTYWSNAARNTADSGVISPTGGSSWKHTIPSGTSSNFSQGVTVTASATTTYSVLARAGSVSQINFREANYTGFTVTFTLTGNGTATSGGVIKPWANGWYLCSLPFGYSAGQTSGLVTMGISGVAGDYAYFACPQVELGAFATSYIPTVAAPVVRNADDVSMTGTNFSDWYVSSSAALAAAVIPSIATGTRPIWQLDDTTANEIIALRGNVVNPELYIVDNGTPQAQLDAGTITANTQYNLCAAFTTNSCAVSQNGASPVTTATSTMPTVTQARIGSDGSNFLNGTVRTLRYWPQRVLNAETQAFSK